MSSLYLSYANSKGSGKSAHMCSVVRSLAASTHKANAKPNIRAHAHLTLFILMNFPMFIHTISIDLPILYFKGFTQ